MTKSRNKKQKKDDKKKDDKDVKISAVGMVDKHGGKIIELVTDSDCSVPFTNWTVHQWFEAFTNLPFINRVHATLVEPFGNPRH